MNCIFCCVFNKKEYVGMCFLLLESIFAYGELDDNTEILIYTSTEFMNIIKQSSLYNNKITFETNDKINSVDLACKARLDLFNLQSVSRYEKILYLDTDLVVKGDINKVFDICKEDLLYTVQEGSIDSDHNYWGLTLFGEEVNNYEDKSAFTSGVLLFKNCEKMKFLFGKINEDINTRYHSFHDQPFIVYNAFKYNLYNNKLLSSLVLNTDKFDIKNDKVILHFSGDVGNGSHKIQLMNTTLSGLNELNIINCIIKAKQYIDENLMPIIKSTGELLEGNIFMQHHSTNYTDVFLNKVKNIITLVSNKNIKNIMEIGFNSGFSTLLMLIANPRCRVTCFDLGEHVYTLPCYNKLKETFGDRLSITIGDSVQTLKNVNGTYDLIHIDGGHQTEVAESDIINSYRLSKPGTILIMDDYDFNNLHALWNRYIVEYKLKPISTRLHESRHHDVKFV